MGYENDQTLVLQNKGTGSIEDVSAFLQENQVQYILTRIPTSHLKENADTTRDVFIAYTGMTCFPIHRTRTHMRGGEGPE